MHLYICIHYIYLSIYEILDIIDRCILTSYQFNYKIVVFPILTKPVGTSEYSAIDFRKNTE
jgi:hypothetical protein